MGLRNFRFFAVIFVLLLGFCTCAQASVTDTNLDVTYTATSTFVAGSGNTYDVFLTMDPTDFSGGNGYVAAVAMQFKTGSDVAQSVTLLESPGSTSDWLGEPSGISQKNGACDMTGGSSGDFCFEATNTSDALAPGGPYTFEFQVTMPGTDALSATSDIKVAYTSLTGATLGQSSISSFTIQQIAPTPEPGTIFLFGTGLLLVGLIVHRQLDY